MGADESLEAHATTDKAIIDVRAGSDDAQVRPPAAKPCARKPTETGVVPRPEPACLWAAAGVGGDWDSGSGAVCGKYSIVGAVWLNSVPSC